jgi:hypothetical protein
VTAAATPVVAVRWRVGLLALGAMGGVAGVLAGLARLGVGVPDAAAGKAALHGPLMIGGFFGVVIALERAVALGRRAAYIAPLLAGLATLAAFAGWPHAPWLLVGASLVLFAATADVCRRQPALFTFTLLCGVACWLAGNLAWAQGGAAHASTWWWLAFLVLTIAGERLELSRLLPPSPVAQRVFAAILALFAVALPLSGTAGGVRLLGAALLALAAWLVRQDVARRTVRTRGITRYVAVCLLSGYAWLACAGALLLAGEVAPGGAQRDAALHALALGFVFAMVFGHAPIIVPAVLRTPLPYRPLFYVPLALLHASLLGRVAGDLAGAAALVRAAAIANALVLALFVVTMATAVLRARTA